MVNIKLFIHSRYLERWNELYVDCVLFFFLSHVEGDDEDEVFDNEPAPSTNKHDEKPSLRAEPVQRPNIPARPPVPPPAPPAPQSPVQAQQFEPEDNSESDYDDDDNIPNTPVPSIPVNRPATVISPPKPPSSPARPLQPPRRIVPQAPEEKEEDEELEEGDTDEEADERLAQSHLLLQGECQELFRPTGDTSKTKKTETVLRTIRLLYLSSIGSRWTCQLAGRLSSHML